MKVKYLGTLFAAAVLSLGLVTSCAAPEGGGDAPADPAAPEEGAAPADPAAPAEGTGQ